MYYAKNMKYMFNKKVRGQDRRLDTLLKGIDKIEPRFDYIEKMLVAELLCFDMEEIYV